VIAGTVLGHVARCRRRRRPRWSSRSATGARAPPDRPNADPRRLGPARNSSVFRARVQARFAAGAPSDRPRCWLESKEPAPAPRSWPTPTSRSTPCGRRTSRRQIDRRRRSRRRVPRSVGLKPTVSALSAGTRWRPPKATCTEARERDAVDISDESERRLGPIAGPGSWLDHRHDDPASADVQGSMKPHQIISLTNATPGADNTIAKADHVRHIHIGLLPAGRRSPRASPVAQLGNHAEPVDQLIARLGKSRTTRRPRARARLRDPAPAARAGGGKVRTDGATTPPRPARSLPASDARPRRRGRRAALRTPLALARGDRRDRRLDPGCSAAAAAPRTSSIRRRRPARSRQQYRSRRAGRQRDEHRTDPRFKRS